ncbi:MAG: TIGR00266 family protein [Sedimentisphaerales bacterium]|nr:TIGR00266 family protein [Sedimentisphaerales bacterium]
MDMEKSDFEYRFDHRPDFGFLTVKIPSGQTLKVEASAMATMDTHLNMKTKFKGGLSRFLTGESLFINEFTAQGGDGEMGIAPPSIGDMEHVYLENETIFLQGSAFVASSMNIEVTSKWQGMIKGFFSGERMFLIKCSGTGDLWFNSYGGILEVDIQDEYIIDTGHIVAFTEGLDYKIEKVGGYKSLFFSGEGLVCRFRGQGKAWIQTRKLPALLSWVHPFRPVSRD